MAYAYAMQLTHCLKMFVVLALVGMAGMAFTGCSSGSPSGAGPAAVTGADDKNPIQATSATLVVYGMACPLCANNIDKNLRDVEGVSAVQVDMGKGLIHVSLAGPKRPTAKQLADVVENAGFTFKAITIP